MAHLVESRTRLRIQRMTRVRVPSGAQEKLNEFFFRLGYNTIQQYFINLSKEIGSLLSSFLNISTEIM